MSSPSPDMVRIRPVLESDLEVFFEHQRDPVATRMAAFPARDRDAFLAPQARIAADPAVVRRTVLVDEAVAGSLGSWEQDGMRLLGYWFGAEYWGRGIATTALGLFVHELPYRPLHAYVALENVGSIRVLEKSGFQRAELPSGYVPAADGVEELLFVLP